MYLQGLSHLSAQQVVASSDMGPFAIAGVLLDAATSNAERGATTTITLGPSSLAPVPGAAGASTATFAGSTTLTTTISGPKGSGTFSDTISGPLSVTDEAGWWRVTDFTYDGQPVQVWPERASQTVNGLNLSVGYVVSYGNTTAALVTLRQVSGAADVHIQSVTLGTAASAENGVADFTGPPAPSGILRFNRIVAPPASLRLSLSSSSGQPYNYSFAFS
jgi:hypothetical protein